MKKRWKSLIAWVLIITIIGGYGNTALAAGLGDGSSSGTEGGTQPGAGADTVIDSGSEGAGENGSSGGEDKETGGNTGETGSAGGSGTEAGDTGGAGDTGSTGTEAGSTGNEGEDSTQDTEETEESPEAEDESEAAVLTAQAGTYKPYWEDGNHSNLVVFVDFADTAHEHADKDYGECFKLNPDTTFKYFNGDEENPRGMRQYLYNISYGQLRVENIFPQYDGENNTITPYILSHEASYYIDNESAMITEIIGQLKASGQLQDNMNLHLSDPAYNIVDNLNIVVASDSASDSSNRFIAHKATYAGDEKVAGCLVRDYTIVKENEVYLGNSESGVIIHEFLHSLGYPDTYRQGSGIPIGSWDIMSTVSRRVQYPLAYLRSAYTNWFKIPSITESQTGVSLYAASKTTAETKDQQALILKTDYSDTEFFVVEYRKKGEQYVNGQYSNEYEVGIPGSGLLVYRVNTSQETNYVGTTDLIYLFRPGDSYGNDGRELGEGNYNEAHLSQEDKRTSYGSSNFEDSLSEGAITYSDGKNSGIVISNVGSSSGDQITFDVTFYEEDEGAKWRTVAAEKDGEVTDEAASCMDKEGNLYFILKKGNTSYLYQCKDGAFTRLGTAPDGSSHKLAWYNGQLYSGYLNNQYVVKLARWNGSSWQDLYTAPRQANEFSMTSDSKGVYLAYTNTDGTRVYAAGYTAAGMAELGSQVAASTGYAANASVAAENGTVVVMYREAFNNNRVFVKQYNSSTKSWSNVGSQSFSANSGLVKIRGGKVYLMKNGSTFGENKSYLYVYDLRNGGSWQQVGSNPYADVSIAEMDLCFAGGEPYVAYMSGSQTRVTEVKRLQDGAWTNLGGSVARETVTGLSAYSFSGQIYVTYLNTVNDRVSVKAHASESTGVEEGLLISPELTAVDGKNPFQVISEHVGTESGISLFAQGLFEDSFRDQLADKQARELYDLLVEKYVTQRLSGPQAVTLRTPVTFHAHVEDGFLVPDDSDQGLVELRNSFHLAYGAFYMDNPSVFWMQGLGYSLGNFTYERNEAGGYAVTVTSISFTVREYYSGAAKQIASYDAAVQKAKAEIEAGLIEPERYDQVKAIHDYLCERLEYNYAAADNLNASNYGYAHTSSTAFLGYNGKKSVVCEGYAKAFKVLCDQWEIPCVLVIGQGGTPGYAGPHMWNYVQMEDGNWYGVDVTWDDQTSGIRSEYFLAGSSTLGFGQYTFAQEHRQDMYITTGEEYPFVYPELAENVYSPTYQGKVVSEAGGKWLYINEMEAEEPLSDADVVRMIRRNAPKGPFAGISIIRKNGDKVVSADIVNNAITNLARRGKLVFTFWDQTAEDNRVTQWYINSPEEAERNIDGTVTVEKGADGKWAVTLSEKEFPADSVQLMYADSRMGDTYQELLEENGEEILPIYLYTQKDANGKRELVSEGYYEYIPEGEMVYGELHSLFFYDINELEANTPYTLETSRYDWHLEYYTVDTSEEEIPGIVLSYTSEDELIEVLRTLSIQEPNIRIYCDGEKQPEVIKAELLEICASKGFNLEYIRREAKDNLSYAWNFHGIKASGNTGFEDFDLMVDLTMEGAELPVEFLERTYIQVAPRGVIPDCEEVSLKIWQEGIGTRFSGTGNLSLWQRTGDTLRYLRTANRDTIGGDWVSFELNLPSEGSGDEVYVVSSQSEYGWQSLCIDGKWYVIYIENRTGDRVTGWEIVEGRKCYFDSEGYLCQGPAKIDGVWYLFGDYENRTQGIQTGYSVYPLQETEEGIEERQQHFYFADANGLLQKGWQKIDNIWHYFSEEEARYGEELSSTQEGYWVTMGEDAGDMAGRRYYFKNNTTRLKNWQTIDGKRYFFMPEGYVLVGWYPNKTDKNVYYLNELGQMQTGYVQLAASNEESIPEAYFFHTNGVRQYGWQRVLNEEGSYVWHYFNADAASADYAYGQEIPSENVDGFWYEMAGNMYYFISNTRLATGWQTIDGKRYYFDSQGKRYIDTQKIGSAFYHFFTAEEREGVLGTGLFKDGEKTYYANSAGVLQRGWQKIDGIWRFFDYETGEEKEGVITTNYWAVVEGKTEDETQIFYFINGTKPATGWQTIEGRRYYFDANGVLQTGFFKVGNNTYYGRKESELENYPGEVLTGEQTIGGAKYYFGSNYVMYTGWQKIDGVWCYFSMDSESPLRGQKQEISESFVEGTWYWYVVNGKKYCFHNNTSLLKNWQTINGQRYYLDPATGAATVGTTFKIGNYIYCFDDAGVMQKNIILDGYGYNASGYRVGGWQKINNEWHYFDNTDTRDAETWKEVPSERDGFWVTLKRGTEAGETYYFRNNASLVKGWQNIDGKRYYFDSKTGVLQRGDKDGLYTIGANTYYLGDDGALRYGWIQEKGADGPVYYANTSGVLLSGWQKIENRWYYFEWGTKQQDQKAVVERDYFATAHEEGKAYTFYFINGTTLAKGWQTIGGLRYYFDPSTNALQTGFFQVGKAWYYFDEDRTPKTGWWNNATTGKTYYFNANGQAVTGWQNIKDINGVSSRYYFDADGVMQTQRTKVGNVYYFFGPDGKMRTGFVKYCDTTYYFNGNGQMLKGWQTISGQRYYFDSEGALQTGFIKIGAATYYFDERKATLGQLLKGEQKIGKDTYYFNTSGVLQYGWQKLNNVWRYFNLTDGVELETEMDVNYWVTIHMPDNKTERSFINNGATVLKGWQTISGKRYYFDANGLLWTEKKGWLVIGSNRFYFNEEEDDSVYQGFLELTDETGNTEIYYLNGNGQMLKGWQTIKVGTDSGRYYLDPTSGIAWTGHQKIGNNWYYFDPNACGKMATGYTEDVQGNRYYYNTSGVRQYNWQRIDGVWRYFRLEDGRECPVTIDEYYWATITLGENEIERAYIRNGSTVLKGWQVINGQRYYFDTNGFQWTEKKGWLTIGSNRFYFDARKNDSVHQGFLELGEKLYYLNTNGQMLKGWQTIKVGTVSGRYYLDPTSGEVWMGHQKVGNYWYYFDPADSGKMSTGYITDTNKDSYYYNTNGTLLTGWQKLKGETDYRYFDGTGDADGSRIGVERTLAEKEEQTVVSGRNTYTYHWYKIADTACTVNGSRYCFLNNATLLKNRQTIDGKYYWFHSSTGALYTGYFAIGQNRYYSNADGSVYTGFDPCVEGDSTSPNPSAVNVSYYNIYGQRMTGWQNIKDKNGISARYYFNANGIMLKGICWIGNVRYVFHPETGKMITDEQPVEIGGKTYYANTNGTLKTGWNRFYEDGEYIWSCLSSATGEYLTTEVDTSMPEVSRYVWYHVTEGEEAGIYCVYNNASVLKNYQNIGGKRYYFNAVSGKLQKGWFLAGANRCYSDPDTAEITGGFHDISDETYYLNTNGLPLKGWQRIYNSETKTYSYYYFESNGKMATGFQEISNARYYLNDGALDNVERGARAVGNVTIGDDEYYFNGNGVMQYGWFRFYDNEEDIYIWKYFGTDGKIIDPAKETFESPKKEENALYHWYCILEPGEEGEDTENWYCIYNNTTVLKNFYNIGTWRYYFDTKTGILQKGHFSIGTVQYYSDPETGGINRKGLLLWEGEKNLFYYDDNGKRFSGWINFNNDETDPTITNRYYFAPSDGQAASGFTKIGNYYYYFKPDTKILQRNALDVISAENPEKEAVLYYTGRYEYLLSGWQKVNGEWYYFDPTTKEGTKPEAEDNWVTLNGETYYFRNGTTLVKGWQTITVDGENGRYYFDSNGVLQKGWIDIGANRYYTDVRTGKAAAGFKTFVDGVCEDGVRQGNAYETYYFDANGLMKKGWVSVRDNPKEAAKNYYFNANGIMLKGICWIGNLRYVLHPDTGERMSTSVVINGITYYANANGTLKTGWQKVYNSAKRVYESFYYGTDGQLKTGWQEIAGKWYYFDETGVMQTGLQNEIPVRESEAGGKTASYYFNGSGVMQAGWARFYENRVYIWRYFGADGQQIEPKISENISPEDEMIRGYQWYRIREKDDRGILVNHWYCIYNNTTVLKGFYNIGTWRYYFDTQTGVLQKGHFSVGTAKYFSKEDTGAIYRSGLLYQSESGKFYYYDGNGKMAAGWQNLRLSSGTYKYYFQPGTGEASTGLTKIGNYYYYFDPDLGILHKNAQNVIEGVNPSGQRALYYTGRYEYLLSGWQKINGSWYYFDALTKEGQKADTTSESVSNWLMLNGGTEYYFRNGTTLLKGWQTISVDGVSGRYYFDNNGVLQKGWIDIGANRYYTDVKTGKAVTGLKTFVNGICEDGVRKGDEYHSYYFDNNGLMKKGWVTPPNSGKYYYFNANGIMLKGICWIGNVRYVLDPDTGEKITTSTVINGVTYYANSNGTLKTGLQRIYNSTKRVYETYYYGTDGRLYTGWQEINGQKYYFDEDGIMQTGYQSSLSAEGSTDSEKTDAYYFNNNGVMQTGWFRFTENKVNVWRYFGADGKELAVTKLGDTTPMGEKFAAYVWYEVEEPVLDSSMTIEEGDKESAHTVKNIYCIQSDKTVLKNFYNIGNSFRYYFDAKTGVLQKGLFTVGTVKYYSDPETGAINRAGTFLTDAEGELYYYDGNGKQVTGWLTIRTGEKAGKYYFNTLTGMAYCGGWYYIDNVQYLFDMDGKVREVPTLVSVVTNNYRTVTATWKEVAGAKRYILEYATDAAFTKPQRVAVENDKQVIEIREMEEGVRYYFRLKYELESKKTGEVEESTYSAVKNIVIQSELAPSGTSAAFQSFSLAPVANSYAEGMEEEKTEDTGNAKDGIHTEFTVKGRIRSYDGDSNYYLVRVDSYSNKILSQPLYEVPKGDGVQKGSNFEFSVDMPIPLENEEEEYPQAESMGGTKEDYLERQVAMSKYALAVKSSANGYTLISKGTYVSNPQRMAEYQTPYFEAASKKGIQGASGAYSEDLGTKQTVMNLDLKSVLKSGSGNGIITYHYKGKNYYFADLANERGTVTEYNNGKYGNQISVTMVILTSYRTDYRKELVHPLARYAGAAPYYTLNSSTQTGQELYEAMFSYLGEIFGRDDCYVSNWVLGNEVDSCNAWNYTGSLSFGEYMKCYAASFRQLYYGVKTTRASSRVFISLDNAWNRAVAGYTGKSVLDTFASYIQAEDPGIEWNVAFHPYSAPLTRTDFWNDTSNTTNSVGSPFISMRNLIQLTNYLSTVEKKYGKQEGSIRVILSEQGWTSLSYGEKTQAEAIARAYYIAEFNPRVDAFIIRAEIDDWEEMQAGLYMGLRNYGRDTKKTSYYVYKYMDTPRVSRTDEKGNKVMQTTAITDYQRDCLDVNDENKSRFMDAKAILCDPKNWSAVSGYDVEKLNQMPYANIPDLKKLPE